MKRLLMLLICVISIGGMEIVLSSCNEQGTVNKLSVSEGFHHNELVQALVEMKSISEKDAEAKIAAMKLSDIDPDFEQYRIVSLPAEKDKKHYTIQFILICNKKSRDWTIQSIEAAWIENQDNKDQIFLGSITFRIINEKKIEYLVNGDFFKSSNTDIAFQKTAGEETEIINIIPTKAHALNSLGYLELHGTVKL